VSDAKPKGPRATPGPRPRRPKKLFERPWPWIVIAGLIVGAVFALGTSLLQSAQDAGGNSDDAFFAIASVGVIAVVLMLLVGFYSARKRRRGLQEHLPGTMMVWLKGHVWIGLAAFVAILVHAWLYPITSSITTGKITLAILIVLVLSGIAWRIVYQTVPRRVPGSVGNLSVKDTRSRLEQIQVEIEKALAGASDELRALADQRLSGKGKVNLAELDRQAATLSLDEQATWEELQRLAERRDRYRGREPKQERYHRILQRWKVLHLPLAVILGAAIAIHVADVLGLKEKVSASEAHEFPDSALDTEANVLIMPNVDAANISYNLLRMAAGSGITVGGILLGAARSVHILTPSSTVRRIVNMTALAVVDANSHRGAAQFESLAQHAHAASAAGV